MSHPIPAFITTGRPCDVLWAEGEGRATFPCPGVVVWTLPEQLSLRQRLVPAGPSHVTAYLSWCEAALDVPLGGEAGDHEAASHPRFLPSCLRLSLHSRGVAAMRGFLQHCSHCGILRMAASNVAAAASDTPPLLPTLNFVCAWRVAAVAILPTPCIFGVADAPTQAPPVANGSAGNPARRAVPCPGGSSVSSSPSPPLPPAVPPPALTPLPLTSTAMLPPLPSLPADTDSDASSDDDVGPTALKRQRSRE